MTKVFNYQEILNIRKVLMNIVNSHYKNFDNLEKEIEKVIKKENISNYLIAVQVIPESYKKSGSHEKSWAKVSDIVLALAFKFMGMESKVIRTRGDEADILVEYKDNNIAYSFVGDAKCFRLSRTAKNQKDFKVPSMADWRRDKTFAILCSPLFAYPKGKSQIYKQAVKNNVALISYLHLSLILLNGKIDLHKFGNLLDVKNIYNKVNISSGEIYWKILNQKILEILGKLDNDINTFVIAESDILNMLMENEKEYYLNLIREIRKLNKQQLEEKYIKSLKIEDIINTMKKTVNTYKKWAENI